MIARARRLTDLTRCAIALLLAAAFAGRADAQSTRDTTAAARALVQDLPLTAAQRQAYVGHYEVTMPSGERGGLVVSEEKGMLHAQPEGAPKPLRILNQGDNDFRPEGIPDFVFHFVLEGGRATKFTVRKEDGVMTGVRVK
ncbi:MAG: hypothetical protein ABIP93_03985 [Gemmatimonadaceae bacterium]